METAVKKVGRPEKENALTNAERQRRHRARIVEQRLKEEKKMINELQQYERQLRVLIAEREAVKKVLETVLKGDALDTVRSLEMALSLVSQKIPS